MITNLITHICTNCPDITIISNEVANAISKIPLHTINWTSILTTITICLTTMGTIIGIFKPKQPEITDEKIKNLTTIINLKDSIDKLEKKVDKNKDEINATIESYKKETISQINEIQSNIYALRKIVDEISEKSNRQGTTYDELIKDYCDTTTIFQELYRTLSSYMGSEI